MKKILTIGKLNKVMQEECDAMSDTFQVQMCPEILPMIKTMKDIMQPDLIIINQIGMHKEDVDIFEWIKATDQEIPLVVVTTEDREKNVDILADAANPLYSIKYPPVMNLLRSTCTEMIQPDGSFFAEEESASQDGRRKIMIVDDNPIVLRNMKAFLEEDYNIMIATKGSQALNFINKNKPDLILLDYEMPEMNGLEVFNLLKQNARTKDIPVIFLTGTSEKKSVLKIIQSEPQGYLLKPPVKEQILQRIQEVLG